jgi:hypothetical protein
MRSSPYWMLGEGVNLDPVDPKLLTLLELCATWLSLKIPGKTLYCTSGYRNDPGSVHYSGRGLDFAYLREVMELPDVGRALLALQREVNLGFPYILGNGALGSTFVYRMDTQSGTDPRHIHHVHLQMPYGGWRFV